MVCHGLGIYLCPPRYLGVAPLTQLWIGQEHLNNVLDVLPLEHVRVATPQQFQSMLEFETCERVDFVVNVRCCKNSVRLTTIVEMLNMLFTAFAVRGCMG